MKSDYPIRILCVFSTLDRGGAESMCMNLYRRMDHQKIQFDFVKHTSTKGSFEDEIYTLGGRIYEAPRFKGHNYISYRKWWVQHLRNHPEHQIIHGHFFSISAVYFQIAKQMGRTTVGHIHASASDSALKEFLEQQISRYTDYPFACSIEAGKWIYGDRPFTVLKNALDTELFRYSPERRLRMRLKLGLHDELILGTVANLSSVKNPMGLIDIFLAVKKQKSDCKLLWIGEGACRTSIEKRITNEQIEDDVMIMGTRDDVPDLLQAMDVFLLPSFNEGLPISAIEAQAAGLPCFISDRITREVDIIGLCKFISIDEPDKWAREILSIDNHRSDTSKDVCKSGYDIDSTTRFIQEFYMSIANLDT